MPPSDRQTTLVERNRVIINLLDKLARYRPLDATERGLRECITKEPKRARWWWTAEEMAALAALNSRWVRFGRPPPYVADDSVRQLANRFGRSYFAVHRKLGRLRKKNHLKRPQMFKRASPKPRLESEGWTVNPN